MSHEVKDNTVVYIAELRMVVQGLCQESYPGQKGEGLHKCSEPVRPMQFSVFQTPALDPLKASIDLCPI